jgi:hypothetical protein
VVSSSTSSNASVCAWLGKSSLLLIHIRSRIRNSQQRRLRRNLGCQWSHMDQACFRTLCESQQTAWFREKKRWRNIKLTDPPETVSLSCPLGFWLRKSSMVSPDYRSIGLIRRIERVQRKASKFILNLLFSILILATIILARIYRSCVLLSSCEWSDRCV